MAVLEADKVTGRKIRRPKRVKVEANIQKMVSGRRIAFELRSPVRDKVTDYIEANRQTKPLLTVAEGTCTGRTLALCGAGPSLRDQKVNGVDHIFACNSALTYLYEQGRRVDAGVAIDATAEMLREWADPPPVPYFLASSVDPELVKHLLKHDRPVIFFHSYVGFPGEYDYYNQQWPPSVMVGRGYNVVERFIHVADWMGYERIDVYGADQAYAENDITHANGEVATEAYVTPMLMRGEIDGRVWRTRPDMLMAAVSLVRCVRKYEGKVQLMGDTLPAALLDKDDDFLDLVCRDLNEDERQRTQFQPPIGAN